MIAPRCAHHCVAPSFHVTVAFVKMRAKTHLVVVVDDDESIRGALHDALNSIGLKARSFGSAEEFLDSGLQSETACLITDFHMPGMNGLELQAKLAEHDRRIPIIVITAYGEPTMRALAMKAGAIKVFDKPFDDNVLLETVRAALTLNGAAPRDPE
jgi:FixJ family two-component response regulator